MKIVAVMPAYNEAGRISAAIRGVQPHVHAVVVVDDGSRDTTAAEAEAAGALVLRHAVNRGQGAALKTGTQAALRLGADVIVHLDADGQHVPEYIPALVEPITAGDSDIVYGSRFMGVAATGIPASRRLLLFGARQFNILILGIPRSVTDPQSGLRALSADAARRIEFFQDRMAHCSEILRLVVNSGLRWKEIPVRVLYTPESLKKGQKATDALKIVWQLFIRR